MATRTRTGWALSVLVGGLPLIASAQVERLGEVTFITAQHVYVKFPSTEGIAPKDTLELLKGDLATPCLIVNSMSSTSCVCIVITGCKAEKQDRVRARQLRVPEAKDGKRARPERARANRTDDDSLPSRGERIRGRVSAASYSTIPSARENDHRVMYRLNLDADNIANSKFSADAYLNYRQLFPADLERRPQRTQFFNVYNLAVSYAPDTNTLITLGRKINNSASSLGAIDGLQAERRFGKMFAGAIAGFRPDIFTYDLNLALPQFGAYLGVQALTPSLNTRTTVGLLQQTNAGRVDRRYAYFQHSSTFNGNLNLFGSGELDLYSTMQGGARLTNLFVSARYRIGKRADLFASYDRRQRVVYYETFRNDVEVMLDDDDARQGARLRLNVRPTKALGLGAAYSRRFQADGANGSDNVQLFVNLNKDPEGIGRWSVQANRNTSNYVRSDVLSIRHTRTIIPKHLNMSFYYRQVQYVYGNRADGSPLSARAMQQYYGADLSLNMARTLMLTMLGEMAEMKEERNYRVNISLVKRFDSKRKR